MINRHKQHALFIVSGYSEWLNQDVKQKTKFQQRKATNMNKKVMILFASAVLTASIAGAGCASKKTAGFNESGSRIKPENNR